MQTRTKNTAKYKTSGNNVVSKKDDVQVRFELIGFKEVSILLTNQISSSIRKRILELGGKRKGSNQYTLDSSYYQVIKDEILRELGNKHSKVVFLFPQTKQFVEPYKESIKFTSSKFVNPKKKKTKSSPDPSLFDEDDMFGLNREANIKKKGAKATRKKVECEIEYKEEEEKRYSIEDIYQVHGRDTPFKGLYKFQKEGVQFGISKNGRCLIGDEMGVGKTI